MPVSKLVKKIRSAWKQKVSHALASGRNVRETFEGELNRFYDLFERAIEAGDPTLLDPILLDWTNSPTLSQLEQGEYNVLLVLNQMITAMNETARETLSERDALELISTLIPLFTYTVEKVSRLELERRITHITNELADTRQKLEKLDQTKSNFISVAAHELKTPLTLIEGYTSMMRDLVVETSDSSIDSLLNGVNTGIRRLRQILEDMIDVSLIDNHLLSLNLQPIRIGYLIRLLATEVDETIQRRKLTLEVQDFPESETVIQADNERLYQALFNILTNAIKYTPDGGRINISGRALPGFIEIIVSDTGIGISPEDQSLIFEKFGQLGRVDLHSSGKTKFKGGGPGLGLPITRGIIEAHGGTIWVESQGYDEVSCPGSTFHILLPMNAEPHNTRIAKLFRSLDNKKEAHAEENPPANHTTA